jgi:hypothetical protein
MSPMQTNKNVVQKTATQMAMTAWSLERKPVCQSPSPRLLASNRSYTLRKAVGGSKHTRNAATEPSRGSALRWYTRTQSDEQEQSNQLSDDREHNDLKGAKGLELHQQQQVGQGDNNTPPKTRVMVISDGTICKKLSQ